MKSKILIVLLFVGQTAFAQNSTGNIDTSNYYDHYTSRATMNWLRVSDAVPIIIDELEKNEFSYAFIKVGKLFKIDDEQYFVMTVAYNKDTKFGFIYKQGHELFSSKSDRNFMTRENKSEFQYVQSESVNDTLTKYIQIKRLPKNVFILDENVYKYEYDTKSNENFPVSKEVISEILRQDIRAYLKKVKD